MTLVPCPSCARHVRGAACPFCGAAVTSPRAVQRTPLATRAAFLVGSVALAAGCNSPPAPAYGGPPPSLVPPVATSEPAAVDGGAPMPADAGRTVSDVPFGPAPAYGGPPPATK